MVEDVVTESYSKDGKSLVDLLQEWIDENSYFLYFFSSPKDIKYKCR